MFRPGSTADLDVLLSAWAADPVGVVGADQYRRELDLNQYRLEWSWLLERDGRLLARALWWGGPQDRHPSSLDCLWVDPSIADPAGVAGRLVAAGHAAFRAAGIDRLPELNLDVAPAWREDPDAGTAIAWRRDAVASAGLTQSIERLRYAWTRDKTLPQRSDRLVFVPADDQAFLEVLGEVAQGSLDLRTRAELAELGRTAQAAEDLQFYRSLPGDRAMWRLARDAQGARVGFVIASRSAYAASVSYLGVVPEHRGRGFVDDLLAEVTIMHATNGEVRITGTTDTTNAPMAAAFRRAGYDVTHARVVIGPDPANPLGAAPQ